MNQPFPRPVEKGAGTTASFSGTVVILAGVFGLILGLTIGFGTMLVLKRSDSNAAASASASASVELEPEPPTSATASATAAPKKPAVDPRVAAAQRRLRELSKKIKSTRSKQLDGQCGKFKKGYNKGYLYDGGNFAEKKELAGLRGCVALAQTSKAPWFCCKF
jgi:hypothetical protein